MNNVLFIQFTTDIELSDGVYTAVGNGFTDTYDLCKSKGDFYWINLNNVAHVALFNKQETLNKCYEIEPPINKGIIYISAICTTHLYLAYIWSKKYPNIKFIVGGPAVINDGLTITSDLPENLTFTIKSVESYFGFEDFSFKWNLEIPYDSNHGRIITYTIDLNCYWNNCTYCSGYNPCLKRIRKDIQLEFKNVDLAKPTKVRLNSPSISPSFIREYFPLLPQKDNLSYLTLIRPSYKEKNALNSIKDTCKDLKILFGMGIEFPSDRILNSVNRGITVNEMIETINFMAETFPNSELVMTAILGWNNLQDKDLREAEKFINNIPTNCRIMLTRLLIRPTTKMDDYTPLKELFIGPFYRGYIPFLTREQIDINNEARKLFSSKHIFKDLYSPLEQINE